MKIYTRTGDKGETSLYGGKRVSKASIRVESYGTVDELNSMLGVVVSEIQYSKVANPKNKEKLHNELERIQHDLFSIGSSLANPKAKPLLSLDSRVQEFEALIDVLTAELPQLRNFILPGGGKVGASLHMARTICRRAERRIIELSQKEVIDESILRYFNRLSDLLFTMARYSNFKAKRKEAIWVSK